jgi:hypothetical protein
MWTRYEWVTDGKLLWLALFMTAIALSLWYSAQRRARLRSPTSAPITGNDASGQRRALSEAQRVPLARWEDDGGAGRP